MVDQAASEPVRVKVIEIDGLFRRYHHHIELRDEDRVTILHGRNGVGKTVTLSLVAGLLKGNYSKLTKPPFRRLKVGLADGSSIEMSQINQTPDEGRTHKQGKQKGASQKNGDRPKHPLEVTLSFAGEKPQSHSIFIGTTADEIAKVLHWFDRVGEDRWLDRRAGEVVSSEELERRYGEVLAQEVPGLYRANEPAKLRELRGRVPVHFIEAQRLFKINVTATSYRAAESVTSAVKDIASDMTKRIKNADSTYRATSTRLDDSLPARLFATAPTTSTQPISDLDDRAKKLEEERKRLREIGLLADSSAAFDPHALDNTRRVMFAVYLADNEEKLGVFKDLANRASILLDIVNRKFAPKGVKLDKDKGYEILSHDGRPLDLDALSSGEQHELVLLHNLLFRVEPGALLLIDEPELSLHVTWQTEFLNDLIEIAKHVGFDAIVATHSPYIVGERRDLMVQLGEPV